MRNLRIGAAFLGYGLKRLRRNLTFALVATILAMAGGAAGLRAEPLKILALGDSLTAGYGLSQGEGLVPQLQAWLDARGAEALVQNAGVSGDTTAGGLSRLAWALGDGAGAMMVILGGNDMLRGVAPEEVRANLIGILETAKEAGLPVLLVGMKAPANWGPEYKAAFDAIYPELAEAYGTLFLEDYFIGLRQLGADPADPASLAKWMQADGIHPNAEGVKVLVETLGPSVLELAERARADP